MPSLAGPIVLAVLSLVFGGYGCRELVLAYRIVAIRQWAERAIPGAGGVLLAALFAVMTFRLLD